MGFNLFLFKPHFKLAILLWASGITIAYNAICIKEVPYIALRKNVVSLH